MDAARPLSPAAPPEIEVLILTGLPGSGRTALLGSLLRSLLEQPLGGTAPAPRRARPVVCSHQFAKAFGLETSALRLQPKLRERVQYREVFDFGSGCICCSPDGDVGRLLQEFGADSVGVDERPTHLLIETTGLADPMPFVRLFEEQQHWQAGWRLRGVVAVVDAAQPLGCDRQEYQKIHSEPACDASAVTVARGRLQLEAANVVLLNKADLAGSTVGLVSEVTTWLATRCGAEVAARLHSTPMIHGHISGGDDNLWQVLQALLPPQPQAANPKTLNGSATSEQAPPASMPGVMKWTGWGGGGTHDTSFSTAVVVEDGGVQWDAAEAWLNKLLRSGRVLRVQGFLAISRADAKCALGTDHCTVVCTGGDLDVRVVHGVRGGTLCSSVLSASEAATAAATEAAADAARNGSWQSAAAGAGRELNTCKLFVVSAFADSGGDGTSYSALRERELAAGLRAAMAPNDWKLVADISLDLPSAAAYFGCTAVSAPKNAIPASGCVEVELYDSAKLHWTPETHLLRATAPDGSPLPLWVVGSKVYMGPADCQGGLRACSAAT